MLIPLWLSHFSFSPEPSLYHLPGSHSQLACPDPGLAFTTCLIHGRMIFLTFITNFLCTFPSNLQFYHFSFSLTTLKYLLFCPTFCVRADPSYSRSVSAPIFCDQMPLVHLPHESKQVSVIFSYYMALLWLGLVLSCSGLAVSWKERTGEPVNYPDLHYMFYRK